MVNKNRLIFFLFLISTSILIFSFSKNKGIICSCENNLNICVKEEYKLKKMYLIISLSNCGTNKVLDSMIGNNYVYYQFHAKNTIKLVLDNKDTIEPMSYIFEDNVSGALPYYKQIVSYDITKKESKLPKKLILNNSNYSNEIKLN